MLGPEVTVVIPTLNRRDFLQRTLDAALGQQEVRLEVVVVDDGSDGTAAAVDARGDTRVRVVRHDCPQGAARARNRGLQEAQAPWTAFLDDDDLWAPDKLSRQLAAAAVHGADVAYASAIVIDHRDGVVGLDPAPPAAALLVALLRTNAMPGGCSNVIAR